MNRLRLFSSTLSVSSLRLLGQMVALVSGLLIANFFGATTATDDYYTALILPAALANLIINALTNLFAPIYMQHVHDDPQQGSKIISSLISVVVASLAVATVLCLIAVPLYTGIRDLGTDEAYRRALVFGVLLAVNCPLVGLSRLLGVFSESEQHYNIPALASLLSTTLFVVTLIVTLPLGIYSLLIANVLSASAEVLVLILYTTRKLGLHLKLNFSLHPAVREMLHASVAPALTFLALFFVPTIDRLMASSLDAGSLTAFHYGERPVVALEALVLGGPLLIIYYHWASVNAKQGTQAVLNSVPETISLLCFIFIPICVGGVMLSYPIISILFGRGAFTAVESSAMVFAVLWFSQIFNFLIVVMLRVMLIFKLTWIQLALSIGVVAFNTALNFALISRLGLLGIVLSTLLTRIIITVVTFAFLKRYRPDVAYRPVLSHLARTLVAIAVMIGAMYLLQSALSEALYRGYGIIWQIVAVIMVTLCGAVAYVLAAFVVGHPDLLAMLHIVGQTRYGVFLRRLGIPAK